MWVSFGQVFLGVSRAMLTHGLQGDDYGDSQFFIPLGKPCDAVSIMFPHSLGAWTLVTCWV